MEARSSLPHAAVVTNTAHFSPRQALYENLRQYAKAAHPQQQLTTSAAFVAGATAGSAAAFVTTPLDVMKTRQQVASMNATGATSTSLDILSLTRREGVKALFAGVLPRLARVAPANAIMIASYEFGKRYLDGVFAINESAQLSFGYKPSGSNGFVPWQVLADNGKRFLNRADSEHSALCDWPCPRASHMASSSR